MAQHIRNQQQPNGMNSMHLRKRAEADNFQLFMQRIRSSPRMMLGTIFMILLIIVLVIVALHYFRLYSFPLLSFIPQKPAPSSHLQYFFF